MNTDASYAPGLRSSAVRGGVLMVVLSAIYAPWLLTATGGSWGNNFFSWCFIVWAGCLWLFFPFGALLGGSILRRLRGLSLWGTAMAALGIGLVSGLLLTLALFLDLGRDELIGLMQGGSPGFVFSVTQQLHKLAWHLGASVWPLTTGMVLMWAIFRKADELSSPGGELVSGESPRVRLRLGLRHLATWGLLVGIIGVATTALAIKETPAHQLPLFFLGAAGVPVLGPWIGPAINPGGGYDAARRLAYVATPVLLAAVAPFLLRLRVRPRVATICWCGFLTALLFWLAAGIFSALSSMG